MLQRIGAEIGANTDADVVGFSYVLDSMVDAFVDMDGVRGGGGYCWFLFGRELDPCTASVLLRLVALVFIRAEKCYEQANYTQKFL